jgi:hypothetical protein
MHLSQESTWCARGGLDMFSLPLSGPNTLANRMIVQYFKCAPFEFHAENHGTSYAILLDLRSVELGYAAPPARQMWPKTHTGT